jgi:hypothetical protein
MNKKFFAGLLLASVMFVVISFAFKGSSDDFVRTELYFGLSKPDGTTLSSDEWNAFADTVITSMLTNGCTIIECRGVWSSSGKIIKEPSRLVIALNPIDDKYANNNIESIRLKYKQYYNQSSVLRIDSKVKAAF